MKTILKKGMYITFEGSPNTIYQILDIDNKYVFVEGDNFSFWESKEFIDNIITFDNMKVQRYER